MLPTDTRTSGFQPERFSLFAGDLVNRLFGAIGLPDTETLTLIGRSLVLINVTWGALAVLATASQGHTGPAGENFFKDCAAYQTHHQSPLVIHGASSHVYQTALPRQVKRHGAIP